MLTALRTLTGLRFGSAVRWHGLPKPRADLFGAEGADAVQAEAEDHPILFTQPDVEGRKLRRHCTAVPTVPNRYRRVNQRAIPTTWPLLKVIKERRTTKQTAIAISQKHRRAPLRTAQCPGFQPTRIPKLLQVRRKTDCPRVVETLEHLNQRARQTERGRERAHPATVRVEIRTHVRKEIFPRPVTRADIDRRETTRDATGDESGKRVDGADLVPLARTPRAT